jgi:TonB family protein
MLHLFIRLLVALATFVAGLGVSALWDTLRRPAPAPATQGARFVARTNVEAPPPPAPRPSGDTTISGGILQGKAISKPAPVYPAIARAARAQGTVMVDIVVGENGDVVSARAVSGHPLLQQSAVDAVRLWKFTPTLLSGRPVKVSGQVAVNFMIN